ncbi:hypothetical protein MOB49_09020 [Bacillus haynesii]|uniref:glycosyltransferase n=1 Tax=Bacillus haynesii TaxID=1925021 RepID=UPI00227F7D31|nr:hypothetical protein [Bacillus haynesii]MCY7838661.1 hypothetical protein [Bacillus haynesii]MCY7967232.1 hypothetical protein [Bacillus haynesii]MCY8393033.1 hypothetical protein [Bacillus haynesii]MCY8542512.1 hypothetical protein [Bacillus haynesii]MCY8582649.1 hypothetical protein [Bacillus haynesii]
MIVGKPIIATDVTGVRSVLEGGLGVLVENTEEALTEAMKKYITKDIEYRTLIMNHITIMHRSSFIKMCVSPSSTQKTA